VSRHATNDRFRPDLEGLRAVAILLVLLYHAHVPGFGGGFVGVDVFFVLSGFLITGILIRDLDATGTISLGAFYARRARRLLPAAAVALVVTLLASAVLLAPVEIADVARDGLAAGLYVSNIGFALQATDYLQAGQAPSPLLHFWSLSVEEQFYLLWPALLLLAARSVGRSHRVLATVMASVTVASLVASVALTQVAAPWAFFAPVTRAWELGLGALVAVMAAGSLRLGRRTAIAAGLLGLAGIAGAGIGLSNDTPFPGVAATVPVLGSALVIAAGLGRQAGPVSRLLTVAPMRWLGRISYSLYLWHWPLIVLPAAALGASLPTYGRVALAVVAIPIAAASQRWIEEPFRHGRWIGQAPRRTFAAAGALMLAVGVVAVSLGALSSPASGDGRAAASSISDAELDRAYADGLDVAIPSGTTRPAPSSEPSAPPRTAPGRVPADLVPELALARDDLPRIYGDGCHLSAPETASPACVFGSVASEQVVVLFGDSHAAQWFPALERLASSHGWRLLSLTKSSCPAADVTTWSTSLKREYSECDEWRRGALERIALEHPWLVVISDSRDYTLWSEGAPVPAAEGGALWNGGLERTLANLAAVAGRVVLIGDTPRAQVDPPVCLSRHPEDVLACASPQRLALDSARLAEERAVAATAQAGFVDPTAWVCPSEPCPVVIGRLLVYRDEHHMTATFARALANRLLDELR
jgi:peptidoglycan/LPS O-acetylase OafA/YrhL